MEQDEYIVDDEDRRSNRPFLTAVGVLVLVLVLAGSCAAYSWLSRDGGGDEVALATVSAIETQNAVVAVTNAAVTQTIIAMETEAARPTNTPTPLPPTNTPSPVPSDTPPPTETPVVAEGENGAAGDGTAEAEAMGTPNLSGTSTFGDVTSDNTPTPIPVIGAKDDSLPDTGIDTWGAVLIGLALVGVLLVARRLRHA